MYYGVERTRIGERYVEEYFAFRTRFQRDKWVREGDKYDDWVREPAHQLARWQHDRAILMMDACVVCGIPIRPGYYDCVDCWLR